MSPLNSTPTETRIKSYAKKVTPLSSRISPYHKRYLLAPRSSYCRNTFVVPAGDIIHVCSFHELLPAAVVAAASWSARANATRLMALPLLTCIPSPFAGDQTADDTFPRPPSTTYPPRGRVHAAKPRDLSTQIPSKTRPGAHGLAGRATYRGLCRQDYTPISVTSTTKSPRGARAAV